MWMIKSNFGEGRFGDFSFLFFKVIQFDIKLLTYDMRVDYIYTYKKQEDIQGKKNKTKSSKNIDTTNKYQFKRIGMNNIYGQEFH